MTDKRVKALEDGYVGDAYRKEGDVFTVSNDDFDAKWMMEVDDPIYRDAPEDKQAIRENGIRATRAFGEGLAQAGADPTATAEAVAVDAPKLPTEAQMAAAQKAEDDARQKAADLRADAKADAEVENTAARVAEAAIETAKAASKPRK